MRLIDTSNYELREFRGRNIPGYAILSHRWGNAEVTFQDLQHDKVAKDAHSKIWSCCEEAKRRNLQYIWIDSCCIDKTSSAELSEAINSMFNWYKNAAECYAYLADVPAEEKDHESEGSAFRRSKWFTRGWTLQELLAPREVVFFNRDWVEIGTKTSFSTVISSITGIKSLSHFMISSVAQKMSWASRRETTRAEDIAYCLMGLFDVNMPPLYGEGHNAFMRLQLEILKKSNDESIFAWVDDDQFESHGLLAPSPAAFKNSGDISRAPFDISRPPYLMTNRGLSIELHLIFGSYTFLAPLNVTREGDGTPLAIQLSRRYEDEYTRLGSNPLISCDPKRGIDWQKRRQVYVPQVDYYGSRSDQKYQKAQIFIRASPSLLESGYSISRQLLFNNDRNHWKFGVNEAVLTLERLGHREHHFGAISFTNGQEGFAVIFGILDYYLGANIFILNENLSFLEIMDKVSTDSPWDFKLRIDRISKPVGSRRSISVTLKKSAESEYRVYIVEVALSENIMYLD